MNSIKQRKALTIIFLNVGAVLLGIVSGLFLVYYEGGNVLRALYYLFADPVLNSAGIQQIFVRFIFLYTMGLGISIALKSNLWNIGAQGQFIVGMVMVFVAYTYMRFLNAGLLFLIMIVLAVLGGIIWIIPPAVLRIKFGANEIVITLLLNVVALYFGTYMINGPIRGTQSFGYPITDTLPKDFQFPEISPGLTFALPLTLAIGVFLYFFVERTSFGLHARVVGEGGDTAIYAGIKAQKIMLVSLLASGALCGLAGATYIMGYLKHLDAGQFDTNFGLLAVIVSLLGRKHMLSTGVAALFMGYITTGIEGMAVSVNVPTSIVFAMEGVMFVGMLIAAVLEQREAKRRST